MDRRGVITGARLPLIFAFALLWSGGSFAAGDRAADPLSHGAEVFKSARCFACHGELGGGGVGPKLAGNRMLAVGQFVMARILIGGGVMPAFGGELSNDDIAAVANYVRNSWGNDFGSVQPGDVVTTRKLMQHADAIAAKVSKPQ
jgi:mono/diheme cytochrome c family protein